jgi:HAMP domain-containing protein
LTRQRRAAIDRLEKGRSAEDVAHLVRLPLDEINALAREIETKRILVKGWGQARGTA